MLREEKWLLNDKYAGVETQAFKDDCLRLKRGEPLAYVIGSVPFMGLTIHLDSRPLIPRQETEWWTNEMLSEISARAASSPDFEFLDLCAGSGAIGCAALSRLKSAQVYFGEIESEHKETIRKNVIDNMLDLSRAHIEIGDLFEPFKDRLFDAVATNPPYIPHDRSLPESVYGYEPSEALFAGKDGLSVISRIAEVLPHSLKRDGVAWVECDSSHIDEARDLFERHVGNANIRTDQYGVPRVVVVSFR